MRSDRIRKRLSSPSWWTIIAAVIFILGVNNNQKKWESKVIEWDSVSYYSYLPATFVQKDLKLRFINEANAYDYALRSMYAPLKAPNGNYVIKGSMGMAVLYAPFFFIAHFIAPHTSFAADGFSSIYQFAVLMSGLFYFTIGLFYMRKTLLLFYSEKITSITLIALFFGTNLVCYTTLQAAMSHQYIFFLFALFIWFSIRWHREQRWKYSIILGLVFGMIILVRPVNVLFILFFLLYDVKNVADLKGRMQLLWRNSLGLLLAGVLAFLVFLPQLLYFKYVTGHYFFNSYIGEWFYFAHPHLAECLVGFRKGWLLYTPMMVFALAGLFFLKRNAKPFLVVSVLLTCLYFYILSSWWCWWYGGGFGWRAIIDLYPLLALPMAAFFAAVLYRKKWYSKTTTVFIVLFIILNLFQTIQFHYNIIHYDSMTAAAYVDSFGKLSGRNCDRSLLKSPDYEKARLTNH
jgi:hypothetical protein